MCVCVCVYIHRYSIFHSLGKILHDKDGLSPEEVNPYSLYCVYIYIYLSIYLSISCIYKLQERLS